MKALLSFILVLLLAAPVFAEGFQGPSPKSKGGFQGPVTGIQADTVAKAKDSRDDTRVMLTGNIIMRVAGSDDKYIFRDATGEIVVDIDDKLFGGRTVTPQTRVRLSGKVDKDLMEPAKVDVKSFEIL